MTETMIDGDAFNVIAEGKSGAPAILLVHSLGTNLHVFDRQIAALAPHFHIIRFDLRGHGGSHVPRGDYSIEQFGKDALAVLDSQAIEKAHVVGLSAGGLVGLWLLSHAPERIERAVLANAAAQIANLDFWNERIRTVQENGIDALAPMIAENWFTRQFREQHAEEVRRLEQALSGMSSEGYAGAAAAVRDADFRAQLADINHPVLVIVGKHDPVTPPGVGALIASAIPGAKTVTLEAAHLSPVEAAEAFNDAVLEFLLGANEKPAQAPTAEPAPAIAPKPRRPRAPKPKPAPAADSAPETAAVPDAIPPEMPKHRPRIASKPKEPERAAEPARIATPARKTAVKKASAKKTARKAVKKTRAAKKATAKKAVRKASAKKRVARKVAVKKAPRKFAAKKRVTKKVVRKTARKTAPKKAARKSLKKSAAKKSRRMAIKRRVRR